MYAEDDVSRGHLIVEDREQKEDVRARIFNWVKVLSELYNIGRERHAKLFVAMKHAKSFELNEIGKTLREVFVCIQFAHETRKQKDHRKVDFDNYLYQ